MTLPVMVVLPEGNDRGAMADTSAPSQEEGPNIVEETLAKILSRTQRIQGDVRSLYRAQDDARASINRLEGGIADCKVGLAELQSRIDAQNMELASFEKKSEGQQTCGNGDLAAEVARKIKDLEQQLADTKESALAKVDCSLRYGNRIAVLGVTQEQMTEEIATLRGDSEALHAEVTALSSKVLQHFESYEKDKAEFKTAFEKSDTLFETLAKERDDNKALHAKMTALSSRLLQHFESYEKDKAELVGALKKSNALLDTLAKDVANRRTPEASKAASDTKSTGAQTALIDESPVQTLGVAEIAARHELRPRVTGAETAAASIPWTGASFGQVNADAEHHHKANGTIRSQGNLGRRSLEPDTLDSLDTSRVTPQATFDVHRPHIEIQIYYARLAKSWQDLEAALVEQEDDTLGQQVPGNRMKQSYYEKIKATQHHGLRWGQSPAQPEMGNFASCGFDVRFQSEYVGLRRPESSMIFAILPDSFMASDVEIVRRVREGHHPTRANLSFHYCINEQNEFRIRLSQQLGSHLVPVHYPLPVPSAAHHQHSDYGRQSGHQRAGAYASAATSHSCIDSSPPAKLLRRK